MTLITIEQAIQIALAHHRAGRLVEAEEIYRRVLAQVPDHADALHLLGALAGQLGHPAAAVELIGRAIAINPAVAEYHYNLGEFSSRAGCGDAAIASLRRAIELNSELAAAHHSLGNALRAKSQHDEAIRAYRRAIELEGENPEIWSNLGVALHAAGRLEEARSTHERAIELEPNRAELRVNLGNTLAALGQADTALEAFRHAIALRPDYAEAHNSMGIALMSLRRLDEAIEALKHAIQLEGDHARAHNNLGNALKEQGRLDEAEAALRRAIELWPDLAPAHSNLGNIFKEQGRLELALASYRRANTVDAPRASVTSSLLFALHYHPDYDAQAILGETRRWAARFAEPLAAQIQPHPNVRTPDRILRVGYVSPDFRGHPVGRMLLPLFANRDRSQTEIICYSDARAPDPVTDALTSLADRWRDAADLTDQQLADLVRAHGIDILVDLALHTSGNRMLVFARKPAPVQVSMLGMPTTTGLETIDYRLTDAYHDPPGATDSDYSERSVRLPRCIWIFQPPDDAPSVAALPALRNGFVTFGCLNQFAKVTWPALELWVEILQALPGSRLVLQSLPGRHLEPVRALFERGGIAGDRVEFVAPVPRRDYFHRFATVDLALDPFPYNGQTSTFDALWMGVPVVTLAGRTSVGRAGVSILSNLGIPELIARNPAQYAETAVGLGRDLAGLSRMRAGLRQQMASSPLCDGKQYAADVDAAFRRMWRTWCEEGTPCAH
jgi:predicted O-linked N-acetylglucosamine transferase (SPINDLY family)